MFVVLWNPRDLELHNRVDASHCFNIFYIWQQAKSMRRESHVDGRKRNKFQMEIVLISSQLRALTLHLTFAPKALNVLKVSLPLSITLQSLRFRLKSHHRPQCAEKAGIQNPKLPGGRQWHSPPVGSLAVWVGQLLWFSEHLSWGDCSSAGKAYGAGIWAALASQEPIYSNSAAQAEFPGSVQGPCRVVRATQESLELWLPIR